MTRFLKLLSLPLGDRNILIRAGLLLWGVRIGLWILPFPRLRDLLSKKTTKPVATSQSETQARKVARYVRLMSRYVPVATCLVQALVTVRLLEEAGLPACLRIGVARSNSGELEAHAWVESGGRVVIGGSHVDLARFTVLHPVEAT